MAPHGSCNGCPLALSAEGRTIIEKINFEQSYVFVVYENLLLAIQILENDSTNNLPASN